MQTTATKTINNMNFVRNRKSKIAVISDGVNKKKIFMFLTFSVVLLFVVYFYFVMRITVNIAVYKTMEQEIVENDSSLGDLEFEYMALKNEINFNMAQKLGYVDALNVRFVDKSIINDKLSLVR
ncbi:MAG: hypothetical protein ABIG87_01360 [Patescibacteria group bacterium]